MSRKLAEDLATAGLLPAPKDGRLLTGQPQKLLGDVNVAAAMLSVSPSYLNKLRMKDAAGPPYVLVGSLVRYILPELQSWALSRRCASTSDPVNPIAGRGRAQARVQKAKAAKAKAMKAKAAKQLQPV